MTALAANKARKTRAVQDMVRGEITAADSQTFFEGSMVNRNSSGNPVVATDAASETFMGVCSEALTTSTSNTTKVKFEYGHEEWFASALTKTSIGANGTILDDGTISNAATTTNDVIVGEIIEAETIDGVAGVWVRVRGPV